MNSSLPMHSQLNANDYIIRISLNFRHYCDIKEMSFSCGVSIVNFNQKDSLL